MKLTCFGKYGPYPKGNCACSCYMVTKDGRNVLLDLGCGSLSRVLAKVGIHEIDALVLSHLHADHMGDALTLRYALAAARKLGKRSCPLPVYMPREPAAEAGLISSNSMIDAKYVSDGTRFDICGIEAHFALMPHAVPSYAVSLCVDGRKFVYSGDTSYNEKLKDFAKGADMLLIEAAFLSEQKPGDAVHVTAGEAAAIGKDARVKKLLLTHIFPEYDENEILREAREQFPEACIIEEQKTYEV